MISIASLIILVTSRLAGQLPRTNGVVLAAPRDGGALLSSRFLTGRALYASDPERICIRAVRFFGPEFLRLVKINGQA